MAKIGLLSDTHGFLDPRLFDYFKDVDEIWHAGDIGEIRVLDELKQFKPTRAVFGNIDNYELRIETAETLTFEIEGLKVCMTHIAGRPNKPSAKALDILNKEKPQLFVCGHSHMALVQFIPDRKTLWMNPGACGKIGFQKIQTVFRFQITDGKCKDLEVIEFKR